jgi:tetratricopeptide (TPR) repeat protein
MLAHALLALLLAPPVPAASNARSDPYARVQKAKALLDAGQYERALKIVDGLLREYPRSQSSHLLRGMALDELGRWDEARGSYEAALRIAPKDPQIQARFGMHFIRREAWTDAITYLERSLEAEPDALALFYLSQAHFHTQNKGKALDAIERCVKLAPDNPTMLLKLGEYRAQMGKHSQALEALRRVQDLNPNEPGLDLALGNVYLSLLEVEKARAVLERATEKDPENPAALSSLAEACAKARDHAAARRHYEKLLAMGHDDAPYYLGLGAALLGLEENEAAIRALNEAVKRDPRLDEAHFHLARAYRAAGQPEESQRELLAFKALKASPFSRLEDRTDLERSLWRQAEALVKEGKEAEALKLLAGGNAPDNEPRYLVGALYYSLGRHADAERLLTEAIRVAPNLAKVRAYLGLAYLEQDRIAEAEQAINEEAARSPREPLVLMAMGQLHFKRKEWAEAVRYLKDSRVVESSVLLMLCEAQLRLEQRTEARETARVITTLASGKAETMAAVRRLLERYGLPLDTGS